MRIIDGQYKILNLICSEPLYDKYLVEDLWSLNKKALYVFKHDVFDDKFASFIKENFYRLSNLDNFFLEKSYFFKIGPSISSSGNNTLQLLLSDNFQSEIDFFEYIKTCSLYKKIEFFVSICNAVFFLHVNGFSYSGIPLESILLFNNDGKILVRLKNLVMRKFNVWYKINSQYKFPELINHLDIKAEKLKDIYSLALIFFSIFTEKKCTSLTKTDIKKFFKTQSYNEKHDLQNLLCTIISLKFNKTFGVNIIIYTLAKIFKKEFKVVLGKNVNLLFSKYTCNEVETQLLVSSSLKKDFYVKAENIFLIKGKSKIGKTRFLKEVQVRLNFQKVLTFEYFNIATKSLFDLCTTFLNKTDMLLESQHKISFKEKDFTKQNDYKIFFTQIKKNILALTDNYATAFIIDDIDLIYEFNFIKNFIRLAYEVQNKNTVFIFSYNEDNLEFDSSITNYILSFQKNNFYKKIKLENLSSNCTKYFLENILYFEKFPEKLWELLFLRSDGNPGLLIEILKELFQKNNLIINNSTGFCEIEKNFEIKIKNKKLILNTLINNLTARVNEIQKKDFDLIKYISIFNIAVSENLILSNKTLNEKKYICTLLNHLTNIKILSVENNLDEKKYFITDNILKNVITKNLSSYEKRLLHRKAAEQLQSLGNLKDINELAYQLKNSEELEKARHYCIKLAIRSKRQKDFSGVTDYLSLAIQCTKKTEILMLAKLTLDLGTFYFEIGNVKKSKLYLQKALHYSKLIDCESLLAEVYIQYVFLADILYDKKTIEKYLLLAENIIFSNQKKYSKSVASILRMKSLLAYDESDFEKSLKLCNEIIELSTHRPGLRKEKSNALRIIADIFFKHNEFEKAKDLLDESLNIAEKIGHVRGILYCYINFASLYSIQGNKEKSMEYYRKTQSGSSKYKIISAELVATNYIACEYFNAKQYQLAYRYALHGFSIAKKNKMADNIFKLSVLLVHICLRLQYPKKAKHFFDIIEKRSNSKLSPRSFYDYNLVAVQYYAYFNEYENLSKYLQKVLPYDRLNCDLIIDDINFYLEVYSFYMEPTDKTAEHILDFISKNSKIKSIIEHSYFAFVYFLKLGFKDGLKNILQMLLEIKEIDLSIIDKNKVSFMKSVFKKDNTKKNLLCILKNSFTNDLGLLKIYSIFQLAQIFIKEKKYDLSLAFLIEASLTIKDFLEKIPVEKRFNFFVGEKFYFVVENINAILQNNEAKLITEISKVKENITRSDFNTFIKKDFVKIISNKNNFYYKIIPYFLDFTPEYFLANSLLKSLNTEIKNDINTFLKKIVCELLATEAFIFFVKNKAETEIIARYSYMKTKIDLNLFFKITSSHTPIVLNKKQLTTLNLKTDLKSCMTFPITQNTFTQELENNISAYLYVDSFYGISLIEKKGKALIEKYKNLLGVLIQSYKFYQLAVLDQKTKTLTNNALQNILEKYTTQYQVFSFVYYDFDFLEKINTTYGQSVGDMVLTQVSTITNSKIIEPAILARHHSDKFLVCLPNFNSNDAFKFAEDIRKEINAKTFLGFRFNITISLGIASYDEHSKRISDLLQKAIFAMYQSKAKGKNCTTIWNENLNQERFYFSENSCFKNINPFSNNDTKNFIIQNLKLSNAKLSSNKIIDKYIKISKNFLSAEYGFLVLYKNQKIINSKMLKAVIGNEPFWFDKVKEFLNFESSKTQILSVCSKTSSNSNFQKAVSMLLVPMIFKEKFLGASCFVSEKYIKEFNFEDASTQFFIANIMAHSCYEIYKNF